MCVNADTAAVPRPNTSRRNTRGAEDTWLRAVDASADCASSQPWQPRSTQCTQHPRREGGHEEDMRTRRVRESQRRNVSSVLLSTVPQPEVHTQEEKKLLPWQEGAASHQGTAAVNQLPQSKNTTLPAETAAESSHQKTPLWNVCCFHRNWDSGFSSTHCVQPHYTGPTRLGTVWFQSLPPGRDGAAAA